MNKKIILLPLFFIFVFSSCQTGKSNISGDVSSENYEAMDTGGSSQGEGTVLIDNEIIKDDNLPAADIFLGGNQVFDSEGSINILVKDKAALTKIETDMPEENNISLMNHKNEFIFIVPGSINYRSDLGEKIRNIYHMSIADQNEAGYQNPFLEKRDLIFSSYSDAEQYVVDILHSMHIESEVEQAYCIDIESIEKVQEDIRGNDMYDALVQNGELTFDEFTPEEECYYFILSLTRDGIVYDSSVRSKGESDSYYPSSNIELIYSKDGIVYLSANGIYQDVEMMDTVTIVSKEKAYQGLEEKMDTIIAVQEMEVIDISLVYIPMMYQNSQNPPFLFRPSWKITAEEKSIDKSNREVITEHAFYFDAETGKEIL